MYYQNEGKDMANTIYDKSIIEMLSLFLLRSEDLYAYQIMKKINSMSGGILEVQGGSLYPILYKLTEKGYISDRVESFGKRGRMTHVFYHLTPPGESYLNELIARNEVVQTGIQNVFHSVEEGEA